MAICPSDFLGVCVCSCMREAGSHAILYVQQTARITLRTRAYRVRRSISSALSILECVVRSRSALISSDSLQDYDFMRNGSSFSILRRGVVMGALSTQKRRRLIKEPVCRAGFACPWSGYDSRLERFRSPQGRPAWAERHVLYMESPQKGARQLGTFATLGKQRLGRKRFSQCLEDDDRPRFDGMCLILSTSALLQV